MPLPLTPVLSASGESLFRDISEELVWPSLCVPFFSFLWCKNCVFPGSFSRPSSLLLTLITLREDSCQKDTIFWYILNNFSIIWNSQHDSHWFPTWTSTLIFSAYLFLSSLRLSSILKSYLLSRWNWRLFPFVRCQFLLWFQLLYFLGVSL